MFLSWKRIWHRRFLSCFRLEGGYTIQELTALVEVDVLRAGGETAMLGRFWMMLRVSAPVERFFATRIRFVFALVTVVGH